MSWRPRRVALGVCALACAFLLFRLLENGGLKGMPQWVAIAWTIALGASLIAAPLLIGNGVGLFTSETLASTGSGRAPTLRQWLLVYFGIVGAVVAVAFGLGFVAGVNPVRAILLQFAIVFFLASSRRPWRLFATLRRTGWLALIKDDAVIRAMFIMFGLLVAVLGLFAPAAVGWFGGT